MKLLRPRAFLIYGFFALILGILMGNKVLFAIASLQFLVSFVLFINWKKIQLRDFSGAMIGMFILASLYVFAGAFFQVLLENDKAFSNSLFSAGLICLFYGIMLVILQVRARRLA